MAFRAVDKTSITISFETDLPPSLRDIHPSGVLHASRTDQGASDAEEHDVFAWVQNSLEVNKILDRLERSGFRRSRGIVFVPYSTKENWRRRYRNAPLSMECTETGKVVTVGGDAKKRKYKCKTSMVGDLSLLPDPERDELHVEIYSYLTWLHKKMAHIEDKGVTDLAVGMEADTDRDDDINENDDGTVCKKKSGGKKRKCSPDVNLPELQGVLDKLESTFYIIPNMKYQVQNEGEDSDLERALDSPRKGAPFLEEALGPALTELVEARLLEGRPRRRSRRKKPETYESDRFELMLERLKKFKEEHGHCRVPRGYKDEELYVWVAQARWQKKKTQGGATHVRDGPCYRKPLWTAERFERLDAMGFTWEIRQSDTSWEDHFQQMMEYYREHGKWPVANHKVNGRLGRWVGRQRAFWVEKNDNFMKKRAPRLDEVGFEWTLPTKKPKKNNSERFELMVDRLKKFKEEHGHCRVPRGYKDEELYVWVVQVRCQKKRSEKQGARPDNAGPGVSKPRWTAERFERLDAMGFTWEIRQSNTSWEDHFEQMMEYYRENGSWPVPSTGRLGKWVARQRTFWVEKNENFMKKRAPKLDEVGFEWTPNGYHLINWDEGFEKLMAFGQSNGHYNVACPTGEEGGDGCGAHKKSDAYKFHKWVESLHAMYRSFKLGRQSGFLTEERISLLLEHGFKFQD